MKGPHRADKLKMLNETLANLAKKNHRKEFRWQIHYILGSGAEGFSVGYVGIYRLDALDLVPADSLVHHSHFASNVASLLINQRCAE